MEQQRRQQSTGVSMYNVCLVASFSWDFGVVEASKRRLANALLSVNNLIVGRVTD